MSKSLLRMPAVLAQTGLSRPAVYARMAAGTFPRPVKLGGKRAVAWIPDEIDAWVDAVIAQGKARRDETAVPALTPPEFVEGSLSVVKAGVADLPVIAQAKARRDAARSE